MSSERSRQKTFSDPRVSMWSAPYRMQRRRTFWEWIVDVFRGRA
jgi:hypothetical protein